MNRNLGGGGPVQQFTRTKTPLGKALQGIDVGFKKAGSNIMKAIGMGPGAKGIFKFLRPIFKRIPFIGGLIDFAVSLALGEPLGRAAAKSVGAMLGGALGSFPPLIPFGGPIWGSIVWLLQGIFSTNPCQRRPGATFQLARLEEFSWK